MDKMKVTYEAMLSLAAEFVLDEAVLKFQTNRINTAIDNALAAKDEDTFYRLAKQLHDLKR
ncbi:IDEAL domain-containing protein [Paenibacillus sp. N4]|uniref:IDEAL domain-containing protein n=1 Tax=Paenibacillus vietnamensis TaxID=2590547 RepID=UPI001CD0753A|nr:IDEAL domain-containing protein [Paenibacillus vietnamensis]MCA0754395.1 IDEAL domain-containing protein [Paenibacillus vietnamensis]